MDSLFSVGYLFFCSLMHKMHGNDYLDFVSIRRVLIYQWYRIMCVYLRPLWIVRKGSLSPPNLKKYHLCTFFFSPFTTIVLNPTSVLVRNCNPFFSFLSIFVFDCYGVWTTMWHLLLYINVRCTLPWCMFVHISCWYAFLQATAKIVGPYIFRNESSESFRARLWLIYVGSLIICFIDPKDVVRLAY